MKGGQDWSRVEEERFEVVAVTLFGKIVVARYATLEQCRKEVALAEEMFRLERLPALSTTHTSIEEIASKVLAQFGIQKHMF